MNNYEEISFFLVKSILFLVNAIQFVFFFFISYKGREKNTYIGFLIMVLSFYRSIKYSNLMIIQDTYIKEFFINKSNLFISKFDFLKIKEKYGFIINDNTKVFNHTLQFSCIFFEICYCYEYVKMFKNPLSLGGDIHYLSIFIPIFYFIIKYFFVEKHVDKIMFNKELQLDYFWLIMLTLCVICYIFLIIYSLYIIYQANSNLLIKKSSQFLLIRHIFYFLLFALVFSNCVYTTSFEDKNKKSLWRMCLFGVFEIFLIFVRLGEIQLILCSKKVKKNLESSIIEFMEEEEKFSFSNNITINYSLISDSSSDMVTNSSKLSKILESETNDKNASDKVHTSTILLSIYYIIEGIKYIISNYDDSQISDNCFKNKKYKEIILKLEQQLTKDVAYYSYEIKDNSLNDITEIPIKKIKSYEKLFRNKVYLEEYNPEIFKTLRKIDNIRNEVLTNSFDFDKNLYSFAKVAKGEGKSGSLFFKTYDEKFILKTISDKDLQSFKFFVKEYFNYLLKNHYSLLVRIYGVYTINVGVSHVNMILMENICPFSEKKIIKYKFDLKGSSYKRNTKNLIQNKKEVTLKDLDFLDIIKLEPKVIFINSFQRELVYGIMKNDIELLTKYNLMDYSLFIAVLEYKPEITKQTKTMRMYVSKDQKFVYYIGIIDYLSFYGVRKKLETFIKNFFLCKKEDKTNISAVHPNIYSQRFLQFMTTYVFSQKRNKF